MEKSLALLDAVIDLQLQKISPDTWLKKLAELAGGTAANAISWAPNEVTKNVNRGAENNNAFPDELINLAENIISRAPINGSPFLDDAARSLEGCDGAEYAPFYKKDSMIVCLDRQPARIIIVVSGCKNPEGWSPADRGRFAAILPTLRKANELHRKLTITGNHLNVANQILNNTPRGVIALQPDGKLLKANSMALDILARQDGIELKDDYLQIAYTDLNIEFQKQLHKIRLLSPDILTDFVWNRGYVDRNSNQFYQLALRAYSVDDWQVETHPYDRLPLLTISMPNLARRPSIDELREFYGVTAAQGRVMACMLRGKNINDTAKELHISINTIRSHLRAVYDKLGVNNKPELFRLLSMTLVNYD